MTRFAHFVAHHPFWVLAVVALVTAGALLGIVDPRSGRLRLEIDPAVERLLPEHDDDRRFYDQARERFGSDEFVLVLVEAEDVFDPAVLERLERITRRLEAEPDVSRVLSVTNAVDAEARDGDVWVGPFFETVPRDPAALEALRQRVQAHPIYGGSLVGRDSGTAAVLAFFEGVSGREYLERQLSERIERAAREEAGPLRVLVTGTPHIEAMLSRTIRQELSWILPLVATLAALLCALAFRSVRGVVLPSFAIAVALVWTLGAMAWAGSPINLVSNIVPPLIIALGFAAAMHFVSEYFEILVQRPAADREAHRAIVVRVLHDMGLAIAVNGLTTMLGFASLCVSRVVAIREFGVWSVVGVLSATILSLTLLPALLVLLGPPRRVPRIPAEAWTARFSVRLADFDVRRRRWIFAAAGGLLIAAAVGISQVEVSSGFASSFRTSSPIRASFDEANVRLGGASSLFLVVEAEEDEAFLQPQNLRELVKLQDWLEAQPEVGATASLADGVTVLHRAFEGNAAPALPESPATVQQLLLFGGDSITDGFVDAERRSANIVVRTRVSESANVARLLERLQPQLDALPRRLHARPTGDLFLMNKTMDEVARGQLESLGTAMVTIYLTLALLLTSFKVGLYAFLPNMLPIVVYFGALGVTGTSLNLSTSLIAAISLGVAVDDTVHYFVRFGIEARKLGDERRATATTLNALLRPITFTTFGLCVSFLVLTGSELQMQVQYGLLSAFTMAVAWLLEVTLSPALCSRLRLVTLWDLLRLDLGRDPHLSIPLFSGLSERQARIFALMSRVVSVPAGTRLFSEGDKGREMYVVIDGELTASLAHNGGRVEFGRMHRGEVVGEIALFSEARSADVDVAEDARLLRFENADLERLGRRYPRIAAQVYRNLNGILAQRVGNTLRTLR